MTFSERNLPASPPAGPSIPQGVRTSLLGWFANACGVAPINLWVNLLRREGYGTIQEMVEDFRARFDPAEGAFFDEKMREHSRRDSTPPADKWAVPGLLSIPTPLFLDVLEDAVALAEYSGYLAITEINRLFGKRGIYYSFNTRGQAEWHGDPGGYVTLLRPALDALVDPRLKGARSEFEASMNHHRAGTVRDAEDAIEEAGKSVESAMKVLLQANNVALTGRETARPLFDLLATRGIVVAQADNAVLGVMRIRNGHGGHGSGAAVRTIPSGLSEFSVRSTANAIIYLASLLP